MDLSHPHVMGIVNVTPDSFSDGGAFLDPGAAIDHALKLVAEGASLIDLGAESTRPGALPVSPQQELDRLMPVLTTLRKQTDAWISVDTSSVEVMRLVLDSGADLINDVRALQREGAVELVAQQQAAVCLMHMRGEPSNMQAFPRYSSVTDEVCAFLAKRVLECEKKGLSRCNLLIDPGFGFGKTLEHNYQLLRDLNQVSTSCDCAVLAGLSRKSMIGAVLNKPVTDRVYGSVAAAIIAIMKGAKILRVHDVAATVDAMKIALMM